PNLSPTPSPSPSPSSSPTASASPSPSVLPSPSPSPSPNPSPSPSALPSPSPSPSPSPLPSPSPSPTASPTPIPAVVISEFRTRGPNGAGDEFIELYNYSDTAIDVSNWKIRTSSSGGAITTRVTINNGTIIPARKHFLVTGNSTYSGNIAGDQTYSAAIANDGGIAVTLSDNSIIDQIGLSSGSAFREGMNLAPMPSDANQSYERKPGGANGSTQDTGDNFNDFQL